MTIGTKVWKVGAVKTGAKCCSRSRNEEVSSMGRLPCPWCVVRSQQDKLPKTGKKADVSF